MDKFCDRCGAGTENYLWLELPKQNICLCDECTKYFLLIVLKTQPTILTDFIDYATPEI
jgi:hypothetical protein